MAREQLWRELSERERVCFECPLPECWEYHPDCPLHPYDGGMDGVYSWAWLRGMAREAEGALAVSFPDLHTSKLAQNGLHKARALVEERGMRTWTERSDEGPVVLHIVFGA